VGPHIGARIVARAWTDPAFKKRLLEDATKAINEDGTLGAPSVFATIDEADGWPDGSVCDAQGHVWIGLWGGWRARRYSPAGEIVAEVRLPAANITKIAFGGADLCTAYATSARKGLDAAALAGQPLAGNIFAFEVEVPGLPGNLVSLG